MLTADLDVLGSSDVAGIFVNSLVERHGLNARFCNPTEKQGKVAQVEILASGGRSMRLDVHSQLYALDGEDVANQFTEHAIGRRILPTGERDMRANLLHVLDCLRSTVENAAGLIQSKGTHVVSQAEYAIEVVASAMRIRAYTNRVLSDAGWSTPLDQLQNMIHEVSQIANSAAGIRLHREHGVDILNAIPLTCIEINQPKLMPEIESIRAASRDHRAG